MMKIDHQPFYVASSIKTELQVREGIDDNNRAAVLN